MTELRGKKSNLITLHDLLNWVSRLRPKINWTGTLCPVLLPEPVAAELGACPPKEPRHRPHLGSLRALVQRLCVQGQPHLRRWGVDQALWCLCLGRHCADSVALVAPLLPGPQLWEWRGQRPPERRVDHGQRHRHAGGDDGEQHPAAGGQQG